MATSKKTSKVEEVKDEPEIVELKQDIKQDTDDLGKVAYFVSDYPELSQLDAKGKILFKFSPFFTLDPNKGQVRKGLLTVKSKKLYDWLTSSPANGGEWKEVAYPPLTIRGGVSIVTGAGMGRTPENEERDLKLARELGELEARYMDGEAFIKDTPPQIITRIGTLKQTLKF